MVLGEEQLVRESQVRRRIACSSLQKHVFLKQLFADPERHCHAERLESRAAQKPDRFRAGVRISETACRRRQRSRRRRRSKPACFRHYAMALDGKVRIMLLAGKALFLSGCHNDAVLDQRCRAVVVERRNAKDDHGCRLSEDRVDEGCDSRAFGQNHQAAEHEHQQPSAARAKISCARA